VTVARIVAVIAGVVVDLGMPTHMAVLARTEAEGAVLTAVVKRSAADLADLACQLPATVVDQGRS
jgi:hypothetical protein